MATEKETTAPIPSVAPDGEQPSALARTDSITEIEETHKQFGKIQIMTAALIIRLDKVSSLSNLYFFALFGAKGGEKPWD